MRSALLFIVLSLLPSGFAAAGLKDEPAPPAVRTYFQTEAITVEKVLPPPPTPGSLAAQADLEAVLQAQTWRTPEQEAFARLVDADQVWNHATVLGSWFTKESLPELAAFLTRACGDGWAVGNRAKDHFARPRPPRIDSRIRPCVPLAESASYPSGHSIQAFLWAGILGEIFTEHRKALHDRAHKAAWARILGGVHFPTDTVAGRLLAEAILAELRKSPAYRADIEKCRAEAAALALKKAA